jgi:hypothetical protein
VTNAVTFEDTVNLLCGKMIAGAARARREALAIDVRPAQGVLL